MGFTAGGTASSLSSAWAPADATTVALYQQSQMAHLTQTAGGLYTGQAGYQAPFNPYVAAPAAQAPVPVASPFVTIGPQSMSPTAPALGSQVVYAHYGPSQALAGQAATTAGGMTALPAAGTTSKPAEPKRDAPTEAPKEAPKAAPKDEPKTVEVKSGDSLSKIAAANGTTWQKLYELNKDVVGGDPNLIRPGQNLKLA